MVDPQNGWFMTENPLLQWMIYDLGVPPFQETFRFIEKTFPVQSNIELFKEPQAGSSNGFLRKT